MLRAPHRGRRVERHDLADDQPVEQHPDRRQVLLHARRRQLPRELLHVGRDHHRLDLRQGDPMKPAPVREPPRRDQVGTPRIRVPDVACEELPEFPLRLLRDAEQRRRHPARDPRRDRASVGAVDDGQGVFHGASIHGSRTQLKDIMYCLLDSSKCRSRACCNGRQFVPEAPDPAIRGNPATPVRSEPHNPRNGQGSDFNRKAAWKIRRGLPPPGTPYKGQRGKDTGFNPISWQHGTRSC